MKRIDLIPGKEYRWKAPVPHGKLWLSDTLDRPSLSNIEIENLGGYLLPNDRFLFLGITGNRIIISVGSRVWFITDYVSFELAYDFKNLNE